MSEIPATISQFEEGLLESGFVVYQVFPLSPPGSRRVRRHLRASSDMADLFLAKEPRNSPLAAQPGTRERRSMSPREQDQIIRGLKPKGSKVPLAEGSRVKVKEEIIIRPSGEPVIPCITLTEVNGNHVVIQTNTVENHRRLLRHLNLVFKKSSRADRRASGNGLTFSQKGADLPADDEARHQLGSSYQRCGLAPLVPELKGPAEEQCAHRKMTILSRVSQTLRKYIIVVVFRNM
eukprot:CAMPEP_0194666864 /NCGR_PEP_ID=MMETSP0295-20121207/2989_1 /TAXON_ID=39354 /ORGANISM="Heterosigma akashiwo, Strain CCMP2393" /LENGTH=234 /DNA_ID=CAMNT_0039549235 /DNA_START=36 /DNA_END=738 /DNA_ORIENTATION=+